MEKQAGSEAEKHNPYEAREGLWHHGLLVPRITEMGSEGWQLIASSRGVRLGRKGQWGRAMGWGQEAPCQPLQGSRSAFPATP